MSRDRLAAMRAQQAAQRNPRNNNAGYGYSNEESMIPPPAQNSSFNNGYDNGRNNGYAGEIPPHAQEYSQYEHPRANHGYAQQSQAYSNRRDDDGDDEERRGQVARQQSRRKLSIASGGTPEMAQQSSQQRSRRAPSGRQRAANPQAHIPLPEDRYGEREDEYSEKNASQVALHQGYQAQHEKYAGYPPQSQQINGRSLTDHSGRPQVYEIPALPRQGQQGSAPYMQKNPSATSSQKNDKNVVSNAPVVDMNEFFDELQSIRSAFRDLDNHILQLDQLHNRNLVGTGGEESAHELEQASNQTRKLTNQLRQRIKALQETTRIRTHGQAEQERQTRKIQIEGLRQKYLEIVQSYQNMEMRNRDKVKQKMERQYRIVNPAATDEEVREVVDGGQDTQVFAQALRQTHRTAAARGVLNEVQSRHEDIKKIERTLVELFQLFQDMAVKVEEQDEMIIHIEEKAENAAQDMEVGHQEIQKAVVSAKGARKKRKICFIILLILLLVIGGVVAYVVVKIVIPKVNEAKAANAEKEEAKTVTATEIRTTTRSADAAPSPSITVFTSNGVATTSTIPARSAASTTTPVVNGAAANADSSIPQSAVVGARKRGLSDLD